MYKTTLQIITVATIVTCLYGNVGWARENEQIFQTALDCYMEAMKDLVIADTELVVKWRLGQYNNVAEGLNANRQAYVHKTDICRSARGIDAATWSRVIATDATITTRVRVCMEETCSQPVEVEVEGTHADVKRKR